MHNHDHNASYHSTQTDKCPSSNAKIVEPQVITRVTKTHVPLVERKDPALPAYATNEKFEICMA